MLTTTVRLLTAWKEKKGLASDNAAAIALGITRATISGWKHGKSHAEPALAVHMASDLKLDELAVLAAIEADRATKEANRRAWQRHGRGVAMALMVGLALPLLPAHGTTRTSSPGGIPEQIAVQNPPLCEVLDG